MAVGFVGLGVFELVLLAPADCFAPVDAAEDFAVALGCAGAVALVVDDLVAASPVVVWPAVVWRAAAADTLADVASRHTATQVATKRALRISAQILNEKNLRPAPALRVLELLDSNGYQ